LWIFELLTFTTGGRGVFFERFFPSKAFDGTSYPLCSFFELGCSAVFRFGPFLIWLCARPFSLDPLSFSSWVSRGHFPRLHGLIPSPSLVPSETGKPLTFLGLVGLPDRTVLLLSVLRIPPAQCLFSGFSFSLFLWRTPPKFPFVCLRFPPLAFSFFGFQRPFPPSG